MIGPVELAMGIAFAASFIGRQVFAVAKQNEDAQRVNEYKLRMQWKGANEGLTKLHIKISTLNDENKINMTAQQLRELHDAKMQEVETAHYKKMAENKDWSVIMPPENPETGMVVSPMMTTGKLRDGLGLGLPAPIPPPPQSVIDNINPSPEPKPKRKRRTRAEVARDNAIREYAGWFAPELREDILKGFEAHSHSETNVVNDIYIPNDTQRTQRTQPTQRTQRLTH